MANPENWENTTLPDFLEALSAYAEDIQGYYDNMKLNVNADKSEWSTFADIFRGATIYELRQILQKVILEQYRNGQRYFVDLDLVTV